MSEEKFEKDMYLLEIFLMCVFIIIVLLFGSAILSELEDFYNDYQCSTTTDWEYWESHNCIRYCKECIND